MAGRESEAGDRLNIGRASASLTAWGRLLRLSNLFTVPGDALAGAALAVYGSTRASGGMQPGEPRTAVFMAAGAAVLLLYMAGLLLNDYVDRGIDAVERPGRPIPSGAAKPGAVLGAGVALLGAGEGVAFAGGGISTGLAAACLAVLVLLYDLVKRRFPALGPALMGVCRAGSVLVGAAAARSFETRAAAGSFDTPVAAAAGAAFLYTLLLTMAAAGEARAEKPGFVVFAPGLVPLAFALIGPVSAGPLTAWSILPAALFAAAAAEALAAAVPVYAGQRPMPPFVGRLVRIMLPMQAAWVAAALVPVSPAAACGAAGVFLLARAGAEAAGKRFYGS